jgi:hypothetical protein
MFCRHVYENMDEDICPDCGGYTHKPDYALQHKLFTEYYASDEPKKYVCQIEGGTIRGWWSI